MPRVMDEIDEISTPPSLCLSSSPLSNQNDESDRVEIMSTFEALPSEIITTILSFLPAVSLAHVSATSRRLRPHALNDLLWAAHVRINVPIQTPVPSPTPARTWKDLYTAHHPYWFLVRQKIWFSDLPNTGDVIIARYDHRRGCIEAYRLLAHNIMSMAQMWEHDPDVHIHTFNPTTHLWFDDPIVKLDYLEQVPKNRLKEEVRMQTGVHHRIGSCISLCRPIPRHLQDASMALWPPSNIPARHRVRNESSNLFHDTNHRPGNLAEASDQAFRVRKWIEYNLFGRIGEDVITFSTLVEESYTASKQRPYQGIWVGDYSAHGCEFLLLLQRDQAPTSVYTRRPSIAGLPSGVTVTELSWANVDGTSGNDKNGEGSSRGSTNGTASGGDNTGRAEALDEGPSGSLYAIKLTGDINVPRAQCTWFADDISDAGLIRVADEEVFKGARIVKSMGHVADRGFQYERFIDSQLILISHDCMAQYWERVGHISYYRRVHVDDFLSL